MHKGRTYLSMYRLTPYFSKYHFYVPMRMLRDVIILYPLNDSTIDTFKPNMYVLNILI